MRLGMDGSIERMSGGMGTDTAVADANGLMEDGGRR